MVDQSKFAWRILSRRHDADLYRPLIVQFSENNPEDFLKASKIVIRKCNVVDLNLGCPQNICLFAGKLVFDLKNEYEISFILKILEVLVKYVNTFLNIPIIAKIRIFPDKEKTLAYVRMIVESGISILAVHGRTGEQKGPMTGLENLPLDVVIFSNGHVLWLHDVDRCLEQTKIDVIRSIIIKIAKELENDRNCINAMKLHLFRILRPGLCKYVHLRNELEKVKPEEFKECLEIFEELAMLVEQAISEDNGEEELQWWYCKPYLGPLPIHTTNSLKVINDCISESN
ncbi:hypothetical protein PCK1_002794 [Pneumocystis canis]|nr:hypothetical protein PCK1_002794 [Pneumocystis canis]